MWCARAGQFFGGRYGLIQPERTEHSRGWAYLPKKLVECAQLLTQSPELILIEDEEGGDRDVCIVCGSHSQVCSYRPFSHV